MAQLTENTKLLHKVVIKHEDEVLILKRAEDAHSRPGKWDLAGGNSEWPENDRAGHGVHQMDVAREIFEETGITVGPDIFGSDGEALIYFDTFFDAQKQVFTVICGWLYILMADFDKNAVKISHEHSEAIWTKIDHLDQYDFGGEKGQFVKNIILRSKDE